METAIFKSNSKNDLLLLIELAKKLGIRTKILTEKEIEDVGLANAIHKGRTNDFIDVDSYLEDLRK